MSGNDLDVSLMGDASIVVDSKVGSGAVSLDGDEDRLRIPDDHLINTDGPYPKRTISAWFKVDNPGIESRKQILCEEGKGWNGLSMYVYDGTFYIGRWDKSVSNWSGTFLSTSDIQAGTWHHAVLTLDAGETVEPDALTGYLDGEKFDSGPGFQLGQHGKGLVAGAYEYGVKFHDGGVGGSGPGHAFAGEIDDLRIYNHALDQEEVRILYQSTRQIATPL